MRYIPMPVDRMNDFMAKLDISERDFETVAEHRELFVRRREEFGGFFYDYFSAIPTTRIIMDRCTPPDNLRKVLTYWFGDLFERRLDGEFLTGLWRSGLRHVELNVDQRFVNLGYAVARQFCHQVIQEEIEPRERENLASALDKFLDFCILVATDSFVTATSRCDREVILGIAHQVRNPTTIIGGGVKRLQKNMDKENPQYPLFEAILQENQRLERMVNDIVNYTSVFQEDSSFTAVLLDILLEEVKARLENVLGAAELSIRWDLDPSLNIVMGDPRDLATLFYYLLENAVEALPAAGGEITIRSRKAPGGPFLTVQVENPGRLPRDIPMSTLFEPFYSSKPTGTGFGLAIASLAARKNLGDLTIEQLPEEKVRAAVTLPLAEEPSR